MGEIRVKVGGVSEKMVEKEIQIGRIRGYYNGNRTNLLTVEVELKETDKGLELSICGNIWNNRHTDTISGGQTNDDLREALVKGNISFNKNWNYTKFKELLDIWDRYHLNNMRAGCEHQRALGWGNKKVKISEYQLNDETWKLQREIKQKAENHLYSVGSVSITPEEQLLINLPWRFEGPEGKLADNLKQYYKITGLSEKSTTWLHEEDHPEGVLSKPCPICGYKYGTAWLMEPLPEDVIKTVRSWL